MSQIIRVVVAAAILVSGLALVPLVGLPNEGYRWQTYADAYQPMMLEANYDTGSPGSYFTLNGYNFPSFAEVTILVNGTILGTVTPDGLGNFMFLLDTTDAEEGYYFITTTATDSPMARIWLHQDHPYRMLEDEGELFELPPDLAIILVSLPFVRK